MKTSNITKFSFLLIFLAVLLISCLTKTNNKEASTPIFKPGPFDSAYNGIRPAIQTFTVDNHQVNQIKAANGTEVLIPANCFITADGNQAENAQLEVVEVFSLPQFVASGLITLSNNNLLSSNGMVYINAKSGNENLQLSKGSSLTVSMPTMSANNGFQLFSGSGSNWVIDSGMMETNYAIPLPLNLVYPEGNAIFIYCTTYVGEKNEKPYFFDTTVLNVNNKKYENTIIATEEFEKRHFILWQMMNWMSYFADRDYYFDKVSCEDQKFNYDIWKVYFDHPSRSFKESDSIARKMYIDYFKTNKDKIASFCDEVNAHKRSYYTNWTDTNYYFDFRKTTLEESFMDPLKQLQEVGTEELKLVNNYGVAPDAPDAFEQLLAKGVDRNEINKVMEYNFRRQAKILSLQKIKDAIVSKKNLERMYESTVFSVSKMGWINCDRFYDDPSAGKAVISVANFSPIKLDFIDCSLVIPEINARLSAFSDSTGKWQFTKKEGPYTRLPIGKTAVITGISLQHDSIFFASQKIKIADGLSVNLPMKYINKNNLNDSLAAALKN